jgi:hypothetical protein
VKEKYFGAIQELAKIGAVEVQQAENPEDIRAILSTLALARSARTHARFLLEYSGEELIHLEKRAQESDSWFHWIEDPRNAAGGVLPSPEIVPKCTAADCCGDLLVGARNFRGAKSCLR